MIKNSIGPNYAFLSDCLLLLLLLLPLLPLLPCGGGYLILGSDICLLLWAFVKNQQLETQTGNSPRKEF